jgi:hypothetical protein
MENVIIGRSSGSVKRAKSRTIKDLRYATGLESNETDH